MKKTVPIQKEIVLDLMKTNELYTKIRRLVTSSHTQLTVELLKIPALIDKPDVLYPVIMLSPTEKTKHYNIIGSINNDATCVSDLIQEGDFKALFQSAIVMKEHLIFFEWPSDNKKECECFIKKLVDYTQLKFKPESITLTGKQFDARIFLQFETKENDSVYVANISSDFQRTKSLVRTKEIILKIDAPHFEKVERRFFDKVKYVKNKDIHNYKLDSERFIHKICAFIPESKTINDKEIDLNRCDFINKLSEVIDSKLISQAIDSINQHSTSSRNQLFIYDWNPKTKLIEKRPLFINKILLLQDAILQVYECLHDKNSQKLGEYVTSYVVDNARVKSFFKGNFRDSFINALHQKSQETLCEKSVYKNLSLVNKVITDVLNIEINELATEYLMVKIPNGCITLSQYLIKCAQNRHIQSTQQEHNNKTFRL